MQLHLHDLEPKKQGGEKAASLTNVAEKTEHLHAENYLSCCTNINSK
jgi:hypothetical protein